jgi:pyruvate/2-oxoglutarate/acetoin dehydrogenase E1 component
MTYKDELTKSMDFLASNPDTIFIGQQILFAGNPMSTTLTNVPKEKMIELPVMEETQMGMSLGIAMTGKTVVSFYPRWDFIILAANQMINHLDKYSVMTNSSVNILIRLGKGSDKPLDPGPQHKGSYLKQFKELCTNIMFHDLITPDSILPAYKAAVEMKGIHVLVEYPELYSY